MINLPGLKIDIKASARIGVCFLLCVLLLLENDYGQKQIIDTGAIKNFYYPSEGSISNNGMYSSFVIQNQPYGLNTIVIKSNFNNWERRIIGARQSTFSDDSQFAIVNLQNKITIVRLGFERDEQINEIASSKTPDANKDWLAYISNQNLGKVNIRQLSSGKTITIDSVVEYQFDKLGKVLLIKKNGRIRNISNEEIYYVSLSNFDTRIIWKSSGDETAALSTATFDKVSRQVIFTIQNGNSQQKGSSIWYYRYGSNNAKMIIKDGDKRIVLGMVLNNKVRMQFNSSGNYIFFQIKQDEGSIKILNGVSVDIWHYNDAFLQSSQLSDYAMAQKQKKSFWAVTSIEENSSVFRIEGEDEKIITDIGKINNYLIVSDKNLSVFPWKYIDSVSFYLVNLQNSTRKIIVKEFTPLISISPSDRYVIYYDKGIKQYKCYNISEGETNVITSRINQRLDKSFADNLPDRDGPVGIGGWMENDSNFILYDNFDLWMVDPHNIRKPYNITRGYGKRHHIKFTIASSGTMPSNIKQNDTLLLTAFDTWDKRNGFYRIVLDDYRNPDSLSMGNTCVYAISNSLNIGAGMEPIKAKNTNVWLVQRESATDAPNYFVTQNFSLFVPVSDIHPQSKYNWLTAELYKWTLPDGRMCEGIIYKPENFEPSKKYPIIINYYEQLSSTLNQFLKPDLVSSDINIPLFVSQGYIVFVPDFYFSKSRKTGITNGMAAYNSVLSAIKSFSKYSWIDKNRIGANGHSFGGGITNYLITHTTLFQAAVESAGVSDAVSSYLSLNGPIGKPGESRINAAESGQGRLYATLWEKPELYLRASPVLLANKVSTPLLIMHNMKDYAVPWAQGVEMFLALQRLGKKVWMLQYDNGNHGVYGKDALDYTIRITQFFDHYLKDAPPPIWMTEGIPAKYKGIKTGYELDTSNKNP